MVYSETFDALPAEVRRAVYRRMADRLAVDATSDRAWRVSAADRRAVVEILSDTKADFPRAVTSNP
jgi:hypothetical protein